MSDEQGDDTRRPDDTRARDDRTGQAAAVQRMREK